jgi:hypothetical protein
MIVRFIITFVLPCASLVQLGTKIKRAQHRLFGCDACMTLQPSAAALRTNAR